MVTSTETATASPPPDPIPPPSNGHDLPSFPILKPRSKRRPAKFPPLSDKASTVTDVVEVLEERPWNLRSCRGSVRRPTSRKEQQRPRFSVPLTIDEIEEDIYSVTGSRPRLRPRKRPRIVQKQIDLVYPGLWLTEVTVELYRVPEER
ncbi:hypothetical protein FCM35_KLT05985 [Carex littledalei]|uniref:Uncharacterized protein n=1 Tax=Carex littledalei TaxID=544730 RepID=A0A833QYN5_9POAL|nr:hypothetical protein FCM35_KLT05985 [Carex littledalei]